MSILLSLAHIVILVMMVVAALLAVSFKKILPSVIALSISSLLLSLEFLLLHAPDVAMAEAGVGAALTMALFIFAIRGTR
ncbi:MAG: hydrogenase subunit MbhD domain-containing protein [Atribacterota bacterium]